MNSESLMTRRGQLSLLRTLFLNHRIWKQKSIVNKYKSLSTLNRQLGSLRSLAHRVLRARRGGSLNVDRKGEARNLIPGACAEIHLCFVNYLWANSSL
jgi:hypothetical protein